MSISAALRRVVLVLGAAGVVVPGAQGLPVAPLASGQASPASRREAEVLATSPPGPAALDVDSLRRTWSWPLSPRPDVLAAFVPPVSAYGSGHRGIDLVASQGQAVTAVDAGVVTHVGVIAGRGTVSVTHASGLRSTYEPVSAAVARGDAVTEGQVIGSVSGQSHCGGRCLHLGALNARAYLDPRPLLGGGPVILLPLSPGR